MATAARPLDPSTAASATAVQRCLAAGSSREEEELRLEDGSHPLRLYPALVLPELKAIMLNVPKCASTELRTFFTGGQQPLFRRADPAVDGVGRMHTTMDDKHQGMVFDLGETNASRRMKRDFFTFAFVCSPLQRLVSAYGTISGRLNGGLLSFPFRGGNGTLEVYPLFAQLNRSFEPERFERFTRDVGAMRLTTLEQQAAANVLAFESEPFLESLRAQGCTLRTFPTRPFWGMPSDPLLRRYLQNYRRGHLLGTRADGPVHASTYFLEMGWLNTWAHARSISSFLTISDSDGTRRRLDFVGHVETFATDLQRLLEILNVSHSDLTGAQRAVLSSARHSGKNAHEGFGTKSLMDARRAILNETQRGDGPLAGRIARLFEQDLRCLGYATT